MNTIFSMLLLIVFGAVALFPMVLALNLAGVLGALLGGLPGNRGKLRFRFATIVSALGQSYVNLAFVSFMVSWTLLAAQQDDVVGFLVWPVAFLAVLGPTYLTLVRALVEAKEVEYAQVQVEALPLTLLATLLAFPLFALIPVLMKGWAWVPMVSSVVGAE